MDATPTQAAWVYLLLGASVFVLAVAVVWLFLAPRVVRDQRSLEQDGEQTAVTTDFPPPEL